MCQSLCVHERVRTCKLVRGCVCAQLTIATAVTPEALVSRRHEQAHTHVGEHTLLHGKTLLVLATHDFEDVALRKAYTIARPVM